MKTLIVLMASLIIMMPVSFAQQGPQVIYGTGGKVYKWADERGNVHYTRRPPEYGTYSEINQRPASKGNENLNEESGTLINPDAEMTAGEIIKRNCIVARNNLALLEGVRAKKLTYVDGDGKVRAVDERERAVRIQAAKNQISLYCR